MQTPVSPHIFYNVVYGPEDFKYLGLKYWGIFPKKEVKNVTVGFDIDSASCKPALSHRELCIVVSPKEGVVLSFGIEKTIKSISLPLAISASLHFVSN